MWQKVAIYSDIRWRLTRWITEEKLLNIGQARHQEKSVKPKDEADPTT
jgi:hypothetical protein